MRNIGTALTGIALACTLAVSHAAVNHVNTDRMRMISTRTNFLNTERYRTLNDRMDRRLGNTYSSPLKTSATPSYSTQPERLLFDIDGPDGSIWYCTMEMKSDFVQYELYAEEILKEFTYKIYDSDFKLVGTIHDKVRYENDEVRIPGPENGIGLLPIVTKHYFNSDDKYEVVVSQAFNTETPGKNNYRSLVYSLDGEKETTTVELNGETLEIEVDKPVKRIDSFIADVTNLSTPGNEKIYMTFETPCGEFIDIDFDKILAGDEEEGQKYWQSLSSNGIRYSMYAKADADGNLVKMFEQDLTYQKMQGDQENSPVMLTFAKDDDAYLVFPHYKDTFFLPFYSPFDEMYMRDNNSLVIDLYKLEDSGAVLHRSTEIPVLKGTGDSVLATYYSVGDLRYNKDIDILSSKEPEYLITRSNYTTVSDETSGFCFYKYGVDGNLKSTIFENAESYLTLSECDGASPEALFVVYDDEDGYNYNFVDLDNPGKKSVVNYLIELDGEYYVLGFNTDQVKTGNGFKYAFEVRQPYVDDNETAFMQIAWFNADGSFDRVDRVNMGKNVQYAQTWIDGKYLEPTFLCTDEKPEYMILVKRGTGSTDSESVEEFMVAQPIKSKTDTVSKEFLHLTPCEKGQLQSIAIYPASQADTYRLMVSYAGDGYTSADFYDLPFVDTAVGSPVSDKCKDGISFDGATIASEGKIALYNVAGALVAEAINTLPTSSLTAGVYIAVSGKSSMKIIVR